MAMWNDTGRFQPAGTLRGLLYRFRFGEEAAGDDPPGDLWVDGALSWHPDREFRRTFPALVRAGAGGGGDDHVGCRRLREIRRRETSRSRTARRDRSS